MRSFIEAARINFLQRLLQNQYFEMLESLKENLLLLGRLFEDWEWRIRRRSSDELLSPSSEENRDARSRCLLSLGSPSLGSRKSQMEFFELENLKKKFTEIP